MTQIARMLDISVKTVSNHKMSVMRKMGFRRNAELYGWLRHSARPGAVGLEPAFSRALRQERAALKRRRPDRNGRRF